MSTRYYPVLYISGNDMSVVRACVGNNCSHSDIAAQHGRRCGVVTVTDKLQGDVQGPGRKKGKPAAERKRRK